MKRAGWPIEFGVFIIVKRGQASNNNTTRLIEEDAQHEWKKSCNGSRDHITDIWHFEKMFF